MSQLLNWEIFALCAGCTFLIVTIIWLVGLFQGNHSLIDGYYGFGFAIPVWIAYAASGAASATAGTCNCYHKPAIRAIPTEIRRGRRCLTTRMRPRYLLTKDRRT